MDWFAPATASERTMLARWSAAVGPPIVRTAPAERAPVADTVVVVNWNIALGAGDVSRVLREVRAANPDTPVILLLQEAFREGAELPSGALHDVRYAGQLGGEQTRRHEIEEVAESEGLNIYYVPSMRNGPPRASDEDRGNAILSTLPLSEFTAIELPFERQRRVAIAATVSGLTTNGKPWRLRVVSAHLDNTVGARRGWIFGGEFARTRQARALIDYLHDEDAVVFGGDFNTWFGFSEQATDEIAGAFPDSDLHDRRPTFLGLLKLDHLFFRFPDGWRGHVARAEDRYGSDHSPLIARIEIAAAPAADAGRDANRQRPASPAAGGFR